MKHNTKSRGRKLLGVAMSILLGAQITGCDTHQRVSQIDPCTPPTSHPLQRAVDSVNDSMRFSQCHGNFDGYLQQLMVIAEGDPKKQNKALLDGAITEAHEQGAISALQAKSIASSISSRS